MLNANYDSIGWHVFSNFPTPLRQYALQIQSVLAGIKPACLFPLSVVNLKASVEFLRGLDLSFVIEPEDEKRFLHAQTSPDARKVVRSQDRVRVYSAKTMADARRLAKLESADHDSNQLGLALGYPECCVKAAAERDVVFFDERQNEWRQTNLNICAIEKSSSADCRCNILLLESEISGIAPLSAIAHYPCE